MFASACMHTASRPVLPRRRTSPLQDKFIVLASDGVWEFITSKEAVDIIAQYESAEEACRQVSAAARAARAGETRQSRA